MENPTDNTENTDNTATIPTRPLSAWVRTVDRLLARERHAALTTNDVSPRDARVLRLLASDRFGDRREMLTHFPHAGKRLRSLVERGWVTGGHGEWTLTEEGRATAERLTQLRDGLDARITSAVSEDELAAASATLEAVARALGWNEGDRMPRHHPRDHRGFGPGFDLGRGFGHGHGFGPGFGAGRGFGPHRGALHDAHDAQQAFERGFAAGFEKARATSGV